jgi:hypothetical protein
MVQAADELSSGCGDFSVGQRGARLPERQPAVRIVNVRMRQRKCRCRRSWIARGPERRYRASCASRLVLPASQHLIVSVQAPSITRAQALLVVRQMKAGAMISGESVQHGPAVRIISKNKASDTAKSKNLCCPADFFRGTGCASLQHMMHRYRWRTRPVVPLLDAIIR